MLGAAWAVLAGEATRVVCLVALYVATCAPRPLAMPEPMAA